MEIGAKQPAKVPSASPASQREQPFFGPQAESSPDVFFPRSLVQPKLNVSNPGDVFEREADDMAERVMRKLNTGPAAGEPPPIQRKCAHCEAEEKEKLHRKEVSPVIETAGPDFLQQLACTKGSGFRLQPALQNRMETAFGHDFSPVHLHTDSTAVQMSQQINAQAFTHGSDIYFNTAKYNPESGVGQKLLAHELTHVVQQHSDGPQRIARQVNNAPFLISGIEPTAGHRHDTVFFERNEPSSTPLIPANFIPSSEQAKVVEFAHDNALSPEIELYGYASEEGEDADNLVLIDRRLSAVASLFNEAVIAETGHAYTGTIDRHRNQRASRNMVDYRFWRAVEMKGQNIASSRQQTGRIPPILCNAGQVTDIDNGRGRALAFLTRALHRLRTFQTTPASEPGVPTILDHNFRSHTPSTLREAIQRLTIIERNISQRLVGNGIRRCGAPNDPQCGNAEALTGRLMTFCPSFFSHDNDGKGEIIIHEMGHFSSFDADDRAYRQERVLPFLTTTEALDNAESLLIFTVELFNDARPADAVPSTSDTLTGCGPNEPLVREALAWAQRWNTYALFGVQQTYGDFDNTTFMAPHLFRRLGRADRLAIAGISDRYQALDRVFESNITVTCDPAGNLFCGTGSIVDVVDPAARSFRVCPAYFAQNIHDRIVSLYAEITRLVPEITDAQRVGYAELARDYKIHFWNLPPT